MYDPKLSHSGLWIIWVESNQDPADARKNFTLPLGI